MKLKKFKKNIWCLIVIILIIAISFSVLFPLLLSTLPSGVDTPSHLEKIWLVSQSLEEDGKIPSWDPYWYGGYPPFKYYPPLSYWSSGLLTYFISVVDAYKLVVFASFVSLGVAIYLLSQEMGLGRKFSIFSTFLFLTSYPLFSSISLWGWFPTLVSLPFALLTIFFLEKSVKKGKLLFFYLSWFKFRVDNTDAPFNSICYCIHDFNFRNNTNNFL